jgi:hypothetical protein
VWFRVWGERGWEKAQIGDVSAGYRVWLGNDGKGSRCRHGRRGFRVGWVKGGEGLCATMVLRGLGFGAGLAWRGVQCTAILLAGLGVKTGQEWIGIGCSSYQFKAFRFGDDNSREGLSANMELSV